MANLSLRLEQPDDQPLLRALFVASRAAELACMNWPEQKVQWFIDMQIAARDREYDTRYAGARREIVECDGISAGRLMIHETEELLSLIDIALLADFQNRGIGTKLINGLQQEACAKAKPIRLHALSGSRPALLYARLGFTPLADDGIYTTMEWRP